MTGVKRIAAAIAVVGIGAVVAGCQYNVPPPSAPPASNVRFQEGGNLVASSYAAAERLIENLKGALDPAKTILIASLVDIDSLDRSSTLGRIVSEQIGSRLSQLGIAVAELKLRSETVLVEERKGEFVLSRDLKKLTDIHDAQAVFAGTYAVADSRVYISVRLVDVSDGSLLSSYDYSLSVNKNTRKLLSPPPGKSAKRSASYAQ